MLSSHISSKNELSRVTAVLLKKQHIVDVIMMTKENTDANRQRTPWHSEIKQES